MNSSLSFHNYQLISILFYNLHVLYKNPIGTYFHMLLHSSTFFLTSDKAILPQLLSTG